MRVAALWCVLCAALASCYQRSEFGSCAIACDPNNSTSCPDGLTCLGGRCAAAGDSCPEDGPSPDAPVPEGCIATTFLGVVCPPMPDIPARDLAGNLETTDCTFTGASVYENTCMVFGSAVSLQDVRATGDKPLVVISDSTITVTADLDVGSYTTAGVGAGGNVGCVLASAPGEDGRDVVGETLGGGGGAGGSYQTTGGVGGIGEKGTNMVLGGSAGAVQTVGLRGGCSGGVGGATGQVNGGKGPAGNGGGAVYLVARTSIDLVGVRILAGGSGGGAGGVVSGGGGGGGSGGAILLETPHITAQGPALICANGGGGGGGAEENTPGQQGADACLIGVESALGGIGGSANVDGGDGGEGSTALARGTAGQTSNDGGGGGGGGGGYVVVIGAPSAEVQDFAISPPPLMGGG